MTYPGEMCGWVGVGSSVDVGSVGVGVSLCVSPFSPVGPISVHPHPCPSSSHPRLSAEIYEVGASNLGHVLLYTCLNREEGVMCDRAYFPGPDMGTWGWGNGCIHGII